MKAYPQVNLLTVYKSFTTIGSSFRLKDKIPDSCKSSLIYQYTCDSCKASYIGKTEKQFRVRIFQHVGKSIRTGAWLGEPTFSEIRNHVAKKDHLLKLENFKIIDQTQNDSDLLLLESLHQKSKKPTLGTATQSTPLLTYDWFVYFIF